MSETSLKRAVGPNFLLLFVLGDVLGAGIYTLIGEVSGRVGGAVWIPLAVAFFFAVLTAFSYAELVTKYPRAGGAAVFAQRAYGRPLIAFLVGFCMLAAGVTSAASLARAFAGDYLAEFVDLPTAPVAVAFLVLVGLLNARGIKDSLRANVAMTCVELSGLLLVVVLGASILFSGDGYPDQAVSLPAGAGVGAVLAASVVAFYSYVGFETSANLAEETADPRRAYPRALLGGLAIAGVLYLLVGLAVSVAVPVGALASGTGPLLEVVRAAPISVPPRLFSAIALLAVGNGALLTMIMASRLTYGMGRERLLPGPVTRVLPNRATPGVAIAATSLVAIVLVLTGDLAGLAETTVLLLLFVFLSTNLAVLVLRRSPVAHDHFRAPTILPVGGIAVCLALLTQQSAGTWLRAGLLLLLGVVLYGINRLVLRRADSDTSAYPSDATTTSVAAEPAAAGEPGTIRE
jgi:amino acid transporter